MVACTPEDCGSFEDCLEKGFFIFVDIDTIVTHYTEW